MPSCRGNRGDGRARNSSTASGFVNRNELIARPSLASVSVIGNSIGPMMWVGASLPPRSVMPIPARNRNANRINARESLHLFLEWSSCSSRCNKVALRGFGWIVFKARQRPRNRNSRNTAGHSMPVFRHAALRAHMRGFVDAWQRQQREPAPAIRCSDPGSLTPNTASPRLTA